MPTLSAGDVMDQAAAILNDVPKNMYTYAVQLPYVKKANEALEQLLMVYGVSQQRVKSASISVAAGALTLTLPSDFLLPIKLYERAQGATNNDWVPMGEADWEPNPPQTNTLVIWAFRNNAINFVGSTDNREVLLEYERALAIITTQSSQEDSYLFKPYLAAKTAEYCVRYVGMNKVMADEIRDNECFRAEDNLSHILVGNAQGVRHRRAQFTTKSGLH
jgi:hypothetical protein